MTRVDAAAKVAKGAKAAPARTQVFESADYDELADHPFELGPFWRGSFTDRKSVV